MGRAYGRRQVMKQRVKGKKEIPQDRAVSLFFNIAGILILIVEAYPLIYDIFYLPNIYSLTDE